MAYGAQHLPQNKKTVYRLVLIDTITSLPIAEAIVEKKKKKQFMILSINQHQHIKENQ